MSQYDPNLGMQPGVLGPATRAVPVVPADAADLPIVARRLYVGTGGDLVVVLRDPINDGPAAGPAQPVLLKGVPAGILDVWCRQVWNTGTSAQDIVALA